MLRGGPGYIQDMINRMKNNRNQLRSQKRKKPNKQHKSKFTIEFSEKTVCPNKLARVKKK